MNERGFFTIIGLCLLLVAAIFIKGVQEFETNYSYGVTIYQAEHELQNAAESALVTAVETGSTATQTFTSEKFGTITVEIQSDTELNIKKFIRKYLSSENYTDNSAGKKPQSVTVILSAASCKSPLVDRKIYRRAFAYILNDDESKTIHFLNSL